MSTKYQIQRRIVRTYFYKNIYIFLEILFQVCTMYKITSVSSIQKRALCTVRPILYYENIFDCPMRNPFYKKSALWEDYREAQCTWDKFRRSILYTHAIHIRFDTCPFRNPRLPSKNSNTGTTFSTSDISGTVRPIWIKGLMAKSPIGVIRDAIFFYKIFCKFFCIFW